MKGFKWTACFAAFLISNGFAANTSTPAGYWQTIDDVTHKPKSIIKIWESPEHKLMGKVVKLYSENDSNHKLCKACKGNAHNQPIVGMTILTELSPQNGKWSNGQILDPESGKTYRCSMNMVNTKKLSVRGYIGLPVLGRSQTWERIDLIG